jgi:hypothetical protein
VSFAVAPWKLIVTGVIAAIAAIVVLVSVVTSSSATPTVRWVGVWNANFAGPAGAPLHSTDWTFDVGQGVFGNSEVEAMTDSPYNVHLDGHGGLDITALWSGNAWTSARVQSLQQFSPPAGEELMVTASIEQPDPSGAMGGAYPDVTCGCSAPDHTTTSGGTMVVQSVAVYDGIQG